MTLRLLTLLAMGICACEPAPSGSRETSPEMLEVEREITAPPARPSLHDHPPSDVTVLDVGEDRWHCEPGARGHQLEPLPVQPARCDGAGSCERFDALFDTICSGASPAPSGMSPAGHDVPITIGDEPLRCRRHEVAFVCAVTCFHAIDGLLRTEAERRFLLHIDELRERFGRESDAMTQGVASYPRRQHRWRHAGSELSTELAQDLCSDRVERGGPTLLRTHYTGPVRGGAG